VQKSSESALNSGIPVYSIFTHTSDFVQNEAKILTILVYNFQISYVCLTDVSVSEAFIHLALYNREFFFICEVFQWYPF
jgi:hypothetical protein